MSLAAPRIFYGVYSMTPYNRVSKMPYGTLKVIGSSSIALSAPINELNAGANPFSWAAEAGFFKAEMSVKVKAFPGFLFQQFLGASVTDNVAEAGGSASALKNGQGTSVFQATTGIASVGVVSGSEADVKFGKFVAIATDATHVDVYELSDIDGRRGSDLDFINDSLKITASPLLITTGAVATPIPNTGLELIGGSGTIGMTVGDTAYFSSRPINQKSSVIRVGSAQTALLGFGALILAQKRATAEMVEINAFNCVASGFPLPFEEKKFAEVDCKVSLLYDAAEDAVYELEAVNPLS